MSFGLHSLLKPTIWSSSSSCCRLERSRQRSLSTSQPTQRDLLARYRYAPRPVSNNQDLSSSPVLSHPASSNGAATEIQVVKVPPTGPNPSLTSNPLRPTVSWSEIRPIDQPNQSLPPRSKKALPVPRGFDPAPNDLSSPRNGNAVAAGSTEGRITRTTPIEVLGIHIPPRPIPPGEEECCMSGCVNCVYTIYADSLLEYNDALSSSLTALLSAEAASSASASSSANTPRCISREDWPEEIRMYEEKRRRSRKGTMREDSNGASLFARPSKVGGREMDGSGGPVTKGAKDETKEEMKSLLEGVDPALRAFLEMEARMKAKQREVAMEAT